MRSPCVPHNPTRRSGRRATSRRRNKGAENVAAPPYFRASGLPALLLAKLRDMRSVVLPVPLVQEKQPIHGAFAMLRVNQHSRELLLFHGTPEPIPAIMYGAQQRERNVNWGRLRVGQICPGFLIVAFDHWL